jgi:8-amino-7-oxononanoate synthase
MSIFDAPYQDWLMQQQAAQRYRHLPTDVAGDALNLASNDYLGLRRHPALIAAAQDYAERFGVGAGASRLLGDSAALYEPLELALAQLKGTQAALIMNSGYQANATILTALLDPAAIGRDPVVLADRLIHASLYTACRSAGVMPQRFHHNDLNHLESLLTRHGHATSARVVLVESVYSMDGDCADLAGLIALCQRFGAFLYVDEAHATGVFGHHGGGLASEFPGQIDLVMGTFGKALGSFGAYVAGSRVLIDYLINRCSGFIYSTALPPPVLGAIGAALSLLPTLDPARHQLLQLALQVRDGLAARGYDTGQSTTQIVPLLVGGEEDALQLSHQLRQAGIIAPAIRPPTVPPNQSRLRLALTAAHQPQDLDRLWQVLDRLSPPRLSAAKEGMA